MVKITNVAKESVDKSKLKYFGLGLGYRREIRKDIIEYFEKPIPQTLIQWLEIVPENYIYKGGHPRKQFEEILDMGIPLIPHGVNLSIGSAPKYKKKLEFDFHLLRGLKELFEEIKAPWFSDHLSCSRIGQHYFQELIPVPFTKEAVDVVADNIKFLEDYFQLPFLFENPSYYSHIVKPEMRESTFINSILKKAKCGLLLDVNNVFVNSVNHKYLPKQFVDDIDSSKVVQIHMAGHKKGYKSKLTGHEIKILDTHGENMQERVLELFQYVIKNSRPKAVLLERDSNFEEEGFEGLVDELKKLRFIMDSKLEFFQNNANEEEQIQETDAPQNKELTTAENSMPEAANAETKISAPEKIAATMDAGDNLDLSSSPQGDMDYANMDFSAMPGMHDVDQVAASAPKKEKSSLESDIDSLGQEFMDL